ncbi:hypothetical protein EDC94DRAFT_653019 [Helicostylum pulchrum]|uniref:Protein OS-9 homolog n=1 Tax=Helicostylum pulchrum TaxID=562976 RepID=A0ABP9XK01_9FUNG|nr:hypothetical protein EDC94DRAFT_653019 [Helicostylum pulchrum]
MAINKLLTFTFIVNLVVSSLAVQFVQDDILAFPRYKVVLTNEKISNANFKDVEIPSSLNSIIMTSASGQPFSCTIPNVQIEQERLEREKEEQAKEETEQDLQATIERGLDLLEPLRTSCIRFFANTQQYWTYEYCHNQYVRQFHIERSHDGKVEKETETASFYLGVYPGAVIDTDKENQNAVSFPNNKKNSSPKAATIMRKVGDQRYLVQEWKNGSECDLTEKPRTVEVQFHCDQQGQDRVTSFVEVSTCHYQITVSTPRLCEEMRLSHRHHTESHKIECRPIVPEKLIEQEQDDEQEEIVENIVQDLTEQIKETEPTQDKDVLNLISELTEQVNQLKVQINNNEKKPEISFFTFDEHGNMIPGKDIKQILNAATAKVKQPEQSKDQHQNKQAYHQHYIE